MRKTVAIALAFIMALGAPAQSQSLLLGVGVNPVAGGGGGGYTGPGDVVTAQGFWGLRAYNAAKATALASAINLCDSSLANCHDIHVTSSGGLNATDVAFNSCNTSGLCQIKILYDQVSTQNLTMCTTSGGCPLFIPNGVGVGLPSFGPKPGGSGFVITGTITSTVVPWSFHATLATTTPNAGFNARMFAAPDPVGILCCLASHWSVFGSARGDAAATISANTFYCVTMGTDGTAAGGFVRQNASATTGLNAGSATFGGSSFGVFMDNSASFSELAYYSILLNGTQQGNLNSNIGTYWGLSC